MNKQHPPWGSQIGVAHGGVIGYKRNKGFEPNYDFTKPHLYEVHYKKEESGLRCDIFMGYKYKLNINNKFYINVLNLQEGFLF